MLQPEGSIFELCHVVADMDRALAHWTGVLGAGPFFVAEMRMEHRNFGRPAPLAIKVAFGFSGGLLIELVEPLAEDRSVFREALEERGEGYHHVMVRTGFDQGVEHMTRLGFKPALESTTPYGERAVLFDTRAETGGFVEFMDLHIAFEGLVGKMAQAREDWDGRSDPVRPLADLLPAPHAG